MARLVILSGPSCIGKGPLCAAMARLHPELWGNLRQLTIYNDRAPRVGEAEGGQYHFRPRAEVEALGRQPGFVLIPARADLQALELAALERILDSGHDAFFEGNPYVPEALRAAGVLARYPSLTLFLSPLSRAEISWLQQQGADLAELVTQVQRGKLLQRTRREKGTLSPRELGDVEKRAGCAYAELQCAWAYDRVIPLADGEGHWHWDLPYPIGSAGQAVQALAALLAGAADPPGAERWPAGLLAGGQ